MSDRARKHDYLERRKYRRIKLKAVFSASHGSLTVENSEMLCALME